VLQRSDGHYKGGSGRQRGASLDAPLQMNFMVLVDKAIQNPMRLGGMQEACDCPAPRCSR
jgi:hypothetical protein